MASDKKVINGVEYDLQSTNWQDKINQAVAKGDTNAAAQFEAARNEKINSQAYKDSGGKQTVTNNYQSSGSSSSGSSSSSSSSSSKNDMARRTDLANQKVKVGNYTYTYDSMGYCVKKVKDGGASATSADPSKTASLNQLAQNNQYIAAAIQAAQKGEWDAVGVALNNYTHKSVGADANGEYSNKTANDVMSLLGDVYGYNADKYYKDKYEAVYGEGSWDGTTGTQNPQAGVQTPVSGGSGAGMGGNVSGSISGSTNVTAPQVQTPDFKSWLEEWLEAAKTQQQNAVDFAVSQGINDLTRAEEDAKQQFQTQRNQIDIDEAKAKDNQALYAEARGDKGGIGAAQYDSVMNTAMKNRQAVNSAQTKLATDTQRQIADLRAQGEFEKADKLLQLSQQYLTQLIQLEQWSLSYGLDAAKFQASLEQWAKEFELAIGKEIGYINGMPTLSNQQLQLSQDKAAQSTLASAGETLLSLGILPSESQLAAMGMTSAQAQEAITAAQLAAAAKKTGGGNPTKYPTANPSYTSVYQTLKDAGIKTYEDAYAYLIQNDYTDGESKELASLFTGKIEDGSLYVPAEKTAMQNGTTLDRMNVTDSIGNKLILNQSTGSGDNLKYFISGDGWRTEQEIVDGLYGGALDLVFDPKNKNKYFVVEAVSIR